MQDKQALYNACCENPYDDTARLVYADCLEENGDETQAQYIRESIALSHLTIDDGDLSKIMEQKERFDNTQKTLDSHWEMWILEHEIVSNHFDFTDHKIVYSRGMPDLIKCRKTDLSETKESFHHGINIEKCAWMVKGLPVTRVYPIGLTPRNVYHTNKHVILETQWRKANQEMEQGMLSILSILHGRLPMWLFNLVLNEKIESLGRWEGTSDQKKNIGRYSDNGDLIAITFNREKDAIDCMSTALAKYMRKLAYG